MAKFTRIEVTQRIKETGLIPLFFHEDIELCKKVLKACYEGGARLFEFTARGSFSHEIFASLVKYARIEMPEIMIGVGSVTDAGSASLFMHLDADFIITPVFREDIAIVCNRRKVFWSPGCSSLTEIAKAEEWGCEIVKLFPGDVLGPNFVKSILAPQPWTSIMVTGGVKPNDESLRKWFQSGVIAVGIGSQLILDSILKSQDFATLKKLVSETITIIQKLKK